MTTTLSPRQICVKIAGKLTVDTATVKRVMDGRRVRSKRDRAAILRLLAREGFTPPVLADAEMSKSTDADPDAPAEALDDEAAHDGEER